MLGNGQTLSRIYQNYRKNPAGISLLKVNNRNTRTTKRRSGVFIPNFEHVFDKN